MRECFLFYTNLDLRQHLRFFCIFRCLCTPDINIHLNILGKYKCRILHLYLLAIGYGDPFLVRNKAWLSNRNLSNSDEVREKYFKYSMHTYISLDIKVWSALLTIAYLDSCKIYCALILVSNEVLLFIRFSRSYVHHPVTHVLVSAVNNGRTSVPGEYLYIS